MENVIFDEKELSKLRENLVEVINEYKHRPETELSKKLKRGLKDFNFLPGKVQSIIKDINEEAYNLSDQELYVVSQQVHAATGQSKVDPNKYYPERMAKEIKTNFEVEIPSKAVFPYTFNNVIRISDDDYICSITTEEINNIFPLLQYNPDTQREMRQRKSKDSGEIIETPKVVEKSVREMEVLLEKGQIVSSMLTFNARLGSSDIGEELIYDENNMTLTVTEGTLLDILDGFHRLNAITRVMRKNPTIQETFKLNVLNYDKKRAQTYFSQINTYNPIGSGQIKKMSEARQADFITKQLQFNSELSGKMAASDSISPGSELLVTFGTLSDAIDEIFGITDKPNAIKVSNYLIEFFDTLFNNFYEEFVNNIAETRKTSLLNTNAIFNGYIVLAKRMYDQNIDLKKLPKIIKSIDFSRDNKQWIENEILDDSLRISRKAKKQIIKYFNELKLN